MGFEPNEPEQSHCLGAALKAADIKPGELWLRYFSIGGSIGENEVEASPAPPLTPAAPEVTGDPPLGSLTHVHGAGKGRLSLVLVPGPPQGAPELVGAFGERDDQRHRLVALGDQLHSPCPVALAAVVL